MGWKQDLRDIAKAAGGYTSSKWNIDEKSGVFIMKDGSTRYWKSSSKGISGGQPVVVVDPDDIDKVWALAEEVNLSSLSRVQLLVLLFARMKGHGVV